MTIDGEKTPAQLARESIEVVSDKTKDDDAAKAAAEEVKEEDKEEEEVKEETKEEAKEETKEGEEESEEEIEETADVEKLKKTIERLQKRVGKKTSEVKELAKAKADLEAALEAKKKDGEVVLTQEDIKREAQKIADNDRATEKFVNACNKLAEEATKIDKDFVEKVNELAVDVAPLPPQLIGMLEDIERGGAVLNYLANNPDEYEEIIGLTLGKQAKRLNDISEKLRPKPKPVSKIPPPNNPIKTSNNNETVTISDKDDMETFVRKRRAQEEKRRKMRMG